MAQKGEDRYISKHGEVEYKVLFFPESYNSWVALVFMVKMIDGTYLANNSLPMQYSGELAAEQLFNTKEEAMEVCERHHRLLILQ